MKLICVPSFKKNDFTLQEYYKMGLNLVICLTLVKSCDLAYQSNTGHFGPNRLFPGFQTMTSRHTLPFEYQTNPVFRWLLYFNLNLENTFAFLSGIQYKHFCRWKCCTFATWQCLWQRRNFAKLLKLTAKLIEWKRSRITLSFTSKTETRQLWLSTLSTGSLARFCKSYQAYR